MSETAKKITILGAGVWGTALACTMARNGHFTRLWGRDGDICKMITDHQHNPKYLLDIELAKGIYATTDLAEAISDAEIILVVVPVQATREIIGKFGQWLHLMQALSCVLRVLTNRQCNCHQR